MLCRPRATARRHRLLRRGPDLRHPPGAFLRRRRLYARRPSALDRRALRTQNPQYGGRDRLDGPAPGRPVGRRKRTGRPRHRRRLPGRILLPPPHAQFARRNGFCVALLRRPLLPDLRRTGTPLPLRRGRTGTRHRGAGAVRRRAHGPVGREGPARGAPARETDRTGTLGSPRPRPALFGAPGRIAQSPASGVGEIRASQYDQFRVRALRAQVASTTHRAMRASPHSASPTVSCPSSPST